MFLLGAYIPRTLYTPRGVYMILVIQTVDHLLQHQLTTTSTCCKIIYYNNVPED
jgi:hypothetical protein